MADFIIKPASGDTLKLQDEGGDDAITISTTGNTTLAGTANNIGTVTAGTVGSAVQLEDPAVTGWYCSLNAAIDINSAAVLDFSDVKHLGAAHTESAGTITIGQAGWYFIMITISNNAASSDTWEYYFYKNGSNSTIRGYTNTANELEYAQWSTSLIVDLAVNDTVAWYGNGNLYGAANNDSMTNHLGYRIGK